MVIGVVDEILFVTAVMVEVYFGSMVVTPTVLSAIDLVDIFGVSFNVDWVAAICVTALLHFGDVSVVFGEHTELGFCDTFDDELVGG